MDRPAWYEQLEWHEPVNVTDFITGNLKPTNISKGAGIYAFTCDPASEITGANILYIGKSDGAEQTLRNRICDYISAFKRGPDNPPPNAQKGMIQLAQFYHRTLDEAGKKNGGNVYVRWTGCVAARDIEGTLLQMFDPRFNNKSEHRYRFADNEKIPEHYLYDVNLHGLED